MLRRLLNGIVAVGHNLVLLRRSTVVNRRNPRTDPLLPRGVERMLVRLFGRTIRCSVCGRPLFDGLPVIWRGELWVIGAYNYVAHIRFNSTETLEFRHAALDECPAPERPWVR